MRSHRHFVTRGLSYTAALDEDFTSQGVHIP